MGDCAYLAPALCVLQVSVRMFGVDQFDNPALMEEGSLEASVLGPDGSVKVRCIAVAFALGLTQQWPRTLWLCLADCCACGCALQLLDVVEPSSVKRASAQQQRGAGDGKPVFEVSNALPSTPCHHVTPPRLLTSHPPHIVLPGTRLPSSTVLPFPPPRPHRCVTRRSSQASTRCASSCTASTSRYAAVQS